MSQQLEYEPTSERLMEVYDPENNDTISQKVALLRHHNAMKAVMIENENEVVDWWMEWNYKTEGDQWLNDEDDYGLQHEAEWANTIDKYRWYAMVLESLAEEEEVEISCDCGEDGCDGFGCDGVPGEIILLTQE